jgi:excinuclease ABC subunit B
VVERRRAKQAAYNQAHGIVPRTIIKPVRDSIEALYELDYTAPEPEEAEAVAEAEREESRWDDDRLRGEIARLRDDMLRAASELRFEEAARLRDKLRRLERLELAR